MKNLLMALLFLPFAAPATADTTIWLQTSFADSQHGQAPETFYLKRTCRDELSPDNPHVWGNWQRFVPSSQGYQLSYSFHHESQGRAFDNRVAAYLDKTLISTGEWRKFVTQTPPDSLFQPVTTTAALSRPTLDSRRLQPNCSNGQCGTGMLGDCSTGNCGPGVGSDCSTGNCGASGFLMPMRGGDCSTGNCGTGGFLMPMRGSCGPGGCR